MDFLKPGQVPRDRIDLTTRIFRSKSQELKNQLFKQYIFGRVVAHVHVIKVQKIGLPHAHILIIFKSNDKITTEDQFNRYIFTEIPDPKVDYNFKKIMKHMMHGPVAS